jgi:hypothetical protein
MTTQSITFDAVLGDDGHLEVPQDAAARLAALGSGSTVHVEATPTRAQHKFTSSYGALAHLAPTLGTVDMLEVGTAARVGDI